MTDIWLPLPDRRKVACHQREGTTMRRPPGSTNRKRANGAAMKKGARAATASAEREAPRKQAASTPQRRNQPSPEQNAEWLAKLTRLKTQARSIAGDISSLGSEIKGTAGDTHWKSIKTLHDLMKLDPDEARQRLESLVTVAAQQEIRISWMGNQATFTDVMEQTQAPAKNTTGTRDLDAARAESDGFNSGKNGAAPSDNPHPPGSIKYVSWHDGRDSGQQARETKDPKTAARISDAKGADDRLPSDPDAVQF